MMIYLLFVISSLFASTTKIESITSYAQFTGDDLKDDNPLRESFLAHYLSDDKRFDLNTKFTLLYNGERNEEDFNLYTFDATYWALPNTTRVMIGRSYETFLTVRPKLLDRFSVEHMMLNKRVRAGAYFGIERPLNNIDYYRAESYGAKLSFVEQRHFPLSAAARVERQDFQVAKRDRARFSIQKPISFFMAPELMADFERDLKFHKWSRSEMGFDLYPTYQTSANLRYLVTDVDPIAQVDDPIVKIFSIGEVVEYGARVGFHPNSKFGVSYYFAANEYHPEPNVVTKGTRHSLDFDFKSRFIRPSIKLYRIDSFGGDVTGGLGRMTLYPFGQSEVFGQVEYTEYQKKTSSKRAAISQQIGAAFYPFKEWKAETFVELNSNNAHVSDERLFIQLSYLFWRES